MPWPRTLLIEALQFSPVAPGVCERKSVREREGREGDRRACVFVYVCESVYACVFLNVE